jgi:hypothetical protein
MNEGPLRTVATGLGFVYAGLCLLVFSILWPLIGGMISKDLVFVVVTSTGLLILAAALDVIGRLMCLAMPADRSGSRPIIFVSVLFTLAAVAVSAWDLGTHFVGLPPVPAIASIWEFPVAVLGSVLFIIFLRNLALDVQQPSLASRAVLVLVLGILTFLGFVGFQLFFAARRPGGVVAASAGLLLGSLFLLVLGITTLILYGNLLTYLRAKVLQYAANPPRVPVPTDYAATAPASKQPSDAIRHGPDQDIQKG